MHSNHSDADHAAGLHRLIANFPGMAYRRRPDDAWTLEFVSLGCTELTGLTPEELLAGGAPNFESTIHTDDRRIVRTRIEEALEDGHPFQLVYRVVTTNGKIKWVWEQGQGVFTDDGTLQALEGFVTDITEFRRTEEERLRLEDELRQAQKLDSLGALASGIGHDFNNLLMGILGSAQFALSELPANSKTRKKIQNIREAARRAADLSHELLAYAGEERLELKPTSLNTLIEGMAQLLASAMSKKVYLSFRLDPELPLIAAAPTHLRQMLLAMVTNASESIGDASGEVTISVRVCRYSLNDLADGWLGEHLNEGNHVCLTISDTGGGIDEETVEQIFDPFFSTKLNRRGLGLAAALGIIRGHNGAIQVASEPGRGATFTVIFPGLEPAMKACPQQEADTDMGKSDWQGSGTILVVDDERIVLQVAKWMLQRLGFTVLVAEDGEKGVEVFRKHANEIRCVILDLSMPKMGGEEALAAMQDVNPDVPIILSSGYDEKAAMEGLAAGGTVSFMQKPYELDNLVDRLRELLG